MNLEFSHLNWGFNSVFGDFTRELRSLFVNSMLLLVNLECSLMNWDVIREFGAFTREF
ncbi:hypothetical protein [Peribacillus frigoritolerans]|uniref:hypothetical protein n=1 Tax=Peribacillus frigoritolerans TaxID=450367 RepID=UPI0020793704|nr:hypothetical protein [Peribacillus frigoritolerans]USK73428.1 hypothetical protein LIT31_16470 [Peribacillus frigoritolerans]